MQTQQKQKEKLTETTSNNNETTPLLSKDNPQTEPSSSTTKLVTLSARDEVPLKLSERLNISDVVTASTIQNADPIIQADNILRAFNRNLDPSDSVFTTTIFPGRGERLNSGEFYLGFRNNRAELKLADPRYRIASIINLNPQVKIGVIGRFMQNKAFFGACGSFVLNVPVGHYAKAYKGNNIPILFGPGPHVIHDPTFKFDPTSGFVIQNSNYINHETIHILRVPAGKIAKIWIGADPFLLESQAEPYVFNSGQFQLDGELVPATDKLIELGHIKRVMPDTSEAAISYNNGVLEIIKPREDKKPTMIYSASHRVEKTFLYTGSITQTFPSKETIAERKANQQAGSLNDDEIQYDCYSTSNQLRLGIKILVRFQISDPTEAITRFGKMENIIKCVENLAQTDMGNAISHCSSRDYLQSNRNDYSHEDNLSKINPEFTAPCAPDIGNLAMDVTKNLTKELKACGIRLERFNIEASKILDENIAKEMNKQSLTAAEASVLDQKSLINKSYAEQEALVKSIQQNQANEAIISKAEAELKAEEIRAKGRKIRSESERDAALTIGEQYTKNPALLKIKELEIMASAPMNFLPQSILQPQLGNLGNLSSAFATPFTLFSMQQQLLNSKQPDVLPSQTLGNDNKTLSSTPSPS